MGIPLTRRTVKANVWTRTGLIPAELSEATIDVAIDGALTEFNIVAPRTVYGQLDLLAGVNIYDMPDGVDHLLQFYYGSATTILNNFTIEDMLLSEMQGGLANINFGGNIFENPSLTRIWFSKMKQFQNDIAQPTWEVIDGALGSPTSIDRIRLFRTPEVDSVAFYEGGGILTLDQLGSQDAEYFMKAVLWKVAESRAMALAVAAEFREYGGVQMVPAFDFWNKKAQAYRDEFFSDMGDDRGVFLVG